MPNENRDRARATALAAQAAHMTEFLMLLGAGCDTATRRRWREALSRWRVDTSHWRTSPRHLYSDEQLARAVAASVSIAGVLRLLGVPLAGGSHAHLARRVRAAGLSTEHFLGKGSQRGQISPKRLPPEQVLRVLPPGSARIKTPRLRRALIESGVEERCKGCGGGAEWQGRPLRLVIDHENGEWVDNRLENLRFLCPNCHAQTATWCRPRSARRPP